MELKDLHIVSREDLVIGNSYIHVDVDTRSDLRNDITVELFIQKFVTLSRPNENGKFRVEYTNDDLVDVPSNFVFHLTGQGEQSEIILGYGSLASIGLRYNLKRVISHTPESREFLTNFVKHQYVMVWMNFLGVDNAEMYIQEMKRERFEFDHDAATDLQL